MQFYTSGSLRVNITATGDVGIGTSTPSSKLSVKGDIRILSGSSLALNRPDDGAASNISTNSSNELILSTAVGGTMTLGTNAVFNGSVTATSFTGSFSGSVVSPGSNTQVIYNNSGSLAGSSNLTFDGSTLNLTGTLTATVKSFIIDHPTKPEKKLQYGVLEGPEHSVYLRGKNNTTRIELPDYWYALVDEETITVNLTAIGRNQNIWVEQITDKYIDVNFEGSTCTYFYTIFAERKDIDKLVTEFDK